MLSLTQFLVFVGVFLISYIVIGRWNGKVTGGRRYPPSLPYLPLIGSLPFIRNFNNVAEFFMKKANELGSIFTLRAGNKIVLILNSREAIEEALVNKSYCFGERKNIHSEWVVNPDFKGIIFASTNPEWKKRHKLALCILKDFGFGVKNIMETRIVEECEAVWKSILKMGGKPFDPKDLIDITSSNIINNILFGRRRDHSLGLSDLVKHLYEWVLSIDLICDIVPLVKILPFCRKKLCLLAETHQRLLKCVKREIVESLKDDNEESFVQKYVQAEGPNSDREQLHYVVRDIFGAGTDTSASTLLWAFVALANNPEIQDRLHTDIDAILPRDRFPSLEDHAKLPYVEATILETFRWRSLVPMCLPRATLCDIDVGGYFVPAGIMVVPNLYAIHMNPKIWKDPDDFRPERFLDDKNNVIGRERVMAFGLGRRSCLGEALGRAEVFLVLTTLMQRFTVLPPEGQDRVDERAMEPITFAHFPRSFNVRLVERQKEKTFKLPDNA